MKTRTSLYVLALALLGVLAAPVVSSSATDENRAGHKKVSGVVTQKAGALAVKTPDGATYQLNENASRRHGHEPFKEGDEVTVMVDENNAVIDIHKAGEDGKHTFVTGKLIHVGKMKKEIKLQTAEGEKVFPLEKLEAKTKGIDEGTPVTVEINESGTVIDLHRAKAGQEKH